MNIQEVMKIISDEKIGRCVYKKELNVLMMGPFDLEHKKNKWYVIENIERRGEVIKFETINESEACEHFLEEVRRRKIELTN